MLRKFRSILSLFFLVLTLLFGFAQTGFSQCPPDTPSPLLTGPENPVNGFPLWMQDSNGLTLQVCLDPALCFFDPPEVGNAFSEAIGFGPEAFWWLAQAAPLPGPTNAVLVLGAEAAWVAEVPNPGDQFPFTRLRIRIDAPVAGTYTVTHPYGVEVYEGVTPGTRAINDSFDIPVPAPFFNLSHSSKIGPFLTWDPTIGPLAPLGHIGDGATPHEVVGSPCGNNFFRIDGPPGSNLDGAGNDFVETNLFTVQGQLFNGEVPSPLVIDRATYGRTPATPTSPGQVDVFASSAPTASLSFSGGLNLPVAQIPMVGDGSGAFFSSFPMFDAETLPAIIQVTADNSVGNLPGGTTFIPSTLPKNLVDLVTITRADYDVNTSTLTIEANSSDLAVPPLLTSTAFGDLTLGSLVVTDLLAPPARVMVSSSAGGSGLAAVNIIATAPTNTQPLALDDSDTTAENTSVTTAVVLNDTDPDLGDSVVPGSVQLVVDPANGTADANGDGTVTYTPDLNFFGTDTYFYTVDDTFGVTSNIAAVTITVTTVNIAAPDVVGLLQADAELAITSAGLTVGTITTANSATVPAGAVISQNPLAGTFVAPLSAVDLVVSLGPSPVAVPDVVGLFQAPAETVIVAAGFIANSSFVSDAAPSGTVLNQNPLAGELAAPGSTINLLISSGPTTVPVPNLVGLVQATAESNILAAGLTVGTITTVNSATVPAGDVISQTPLAGTSVAPGSAVDLAVSLGPVLIPVPDVVGLLLVPAENALLAAGLDHGVITLVNSTLIPIDQVISQTPAAGTDVAAGTLIDLVVSAGPAQLTTPSFVTQDVATAQVNILAANLTVGTITPVSSVTVPANIVISQTPIAGTSVFELTAVDLVISSGPPPEILTITRAQFRTGRSQWRVDGNSTNPGPGNTVTIHLGDINGPVLGTAVVGNVPDAAGLFPWTFRQNNSTTLPDGATQVTAESTSGGTASLTLVVRR